METKTLLDFPGHFFEQAIKALLCLILRALVGTIGAVVIRTFIDLGHCFAAVGQETELHHHFKQILVDVLTALAIVEVYRTALAYFIEGRVKVTYLIDAVLVAVLTEVMAFWYREIDPLRVGMVVILVLVYRRTTIEAAACPFCNFDPSSKGAGDLYSSNDGNSLRHSVAEFAPKHISAREISPHALCCQLGTERLTFPAPCKKAISRNQGNGLFRFSSNREIGCFLPSPFF